VKRSGYFKAWGAWFNREFAWELGLMPGLIKEVEVEE
jgi:hypothetical protein